MPGNEQIPLQGLCAPGKNKGPGPGQNQQITARPGNNSAEPGKTKPDQRYGRKNPQCKKTVIVPGYGMAVAQAQFEQGSRI
ncbi:MAG: NAD(P)(+) transhydrogenase (Re/Si-specific) subunit beta [Desulfobacter sp.]|nr:MAG: NAD(P)(+) transhydrogenase (Re/Si-specific) subunit beta [Desulfobacter sp.]